MAKEKKKKKRSSVKAVFVLILILVIVAAVLWFLLEYKGVDFGFGTDSNGNTSVSDSSVGVESDTAETTDVESETDKQVVAITVSGREYLYLNQKIDLDALIQALSEFDKTVEIQITTDETATVNAFDSLVSKLEENGFDNYKKN